MNGDTVDAIRDEAPYVRFYHRVFLLNSLK